MHPDHQHHQQQQHHHKTVGEKDGNHESSYSQPKQVYSHSTDFLESEKKKEEEENAKQKNLNYAYHKNNPNNMMDGDLAVAMAIEEEDELNGNKKDNDFDSNNIIYAIEYDPDSKPPLHKNRRFQLYGVIGLVLLAVIAAGAAIGVGGQQEKTVIVNKSLQGGPTNAPTVYLTPQEQVVYSFLTLHFSPKVREEGTPHYMAAQWVLYEDSYSQEILNNLSTSSNASLDVQFLQRYILAFLWFHSTNLGKDPWRSCNPPTFKNLDINDSIMVTPSAGHLPAQEEAQEEADADLDTCTFLQWNRLENDAVCFGALPGVNRWMSSVDTCEWQGVDCSTGTEVLGLDMCKFTLLT